MILALNTTSDLLTVTLATTDGHVVADGAESAYQRHADKLLPAIKRVLEEVGVSKHELTGILCAIGPGSFTGIRIGVTTANSLAYGLQIPIVGVDTLSLWLAYARTLTAGDTTRPENIRAFIDAGRGDVYARTESLDWVKSDFELIPMAELISGLSTSDMLIGSLRQPAAESLLPLLGSFEGKLFLDMESSISLGKQLVALGIPLLKKQPPFSLTMQLEPLYLRETHITKSKKPRLM